MDSATTHIETEKQFEPALRFPGNMGGWQEMMIGNFANVKSGYTFSREYQGLKNKKWLYLKVADIGIKSNIKYLKTAINTISEETLRKVKAKPYRKGCTIFPRVGMALLNNNKRLLYEDSIVDDNVLAFDIFDVEKCDDEFIFYWFLTKHLSDYCNNGQIPVISASRVKASHVLMPEKIEQQKIASFLSAIDDKVQQLTKKKELLEDYKKGVMQQLFSGELRFKAEDGNDYPDWEENRLGEIATRNANKNKDSAVNFVLTNSATRGVVSQGDYFDREIANQDNLQGYYVVELNDFVYNPRISVHAPVGPVKRNKLERGVMSPLYSVFRFNDENLEYFEQYFETIGWHRYLESVSNKGARHDRMNITNVDFFKMPIPYPCNEERRAITNFLNSVSIKIELAKKELTQTQSFKKGLLQQMFV